MEQNFRWFVAFCGSTLSGHSIKTVDGQKNMYVQFNSHSHVLNPTHTLTTSVELHSVIASFTSPPHSHFLSICISLSITHRQCLCGSQIENMCMYCTKWTKKHLHSPKFNLPVLKPRLSGALCQHHRIPSYPRSSATILLIMHYAYTSMFRQINLELLGLWNPVIIPLWIYVYVSWNKFGIIRAKTPSGHLIMHICIYVSSSKFKTIRAKASCHHVCFSPNSYEFI